MTYQEPNTILICGDAREVLKTLPAESVDMVMTSPPYLGLRDNKGATTIWDAVEGCQHEWVEHYQPPKGAHSLPDNLPSVGSNRIINADNSNPRFGVHSHFCRLCGAWRGQLGSEPSPDLFVKHLCDIFDDVKRVLKKTGTIYVNLDDSHAGSGGAGGDYNNGGLKEGQPKWKSNNQSNVPAKSLIGIPERFLIEMVNRGWVWRNTIIWKKDSVMPESAKDRFTIDYERIYFFAKQNKTQFWTNDKTLASVNKQPKGIHGIEGTDWDWVACRRCSMPQAVNNCPRCKGAGKVKENHWEGHDYFFERQFEPYTEPLDRWGGQVLKANGQSSWDEGTGQNAYRDRNMRPNSLGRNKRTVWTINPKGYKGEHYATYPEELCRTPIEASCPEFVCTKCGKPRTRIYQPSPEYATKLKGSWAKDTDSSKALRAEIGYTAHDKKEACTQDYQLIGLSDCGCGAPFEPGVCLDPFSGTATTGVMVKKLGRKYIGIEISEKYHKLAIKRISNTIGRMI